MNILPFHYLFCFADINQVVLATNAFMIYLFVIFLDSHGHFELSLSGFLYNVHCHSNVFGQ